MACVEVGGVRRGPRVLDVFHWDPRVPGPQNQRDGHPGRARPGCVSIRRGRSEK